VILIPIMSKEEDTDKSFINRKKFSIMVEESVIEHKHGYMDAIIHVCEQNNVEISSVKKYLSAPIISKLEVEAINLNFIRGQTNFEPLE
jgi:hypothetical protein